MTNRIDRALEGMNGGPTRTGITDKSGREIMLGDRIRIHQPYRSTQSHCGENIPRPGGVYTENLEPEIKTVEYVVQWGQGMFYTHVMEEDGETLWPLAWTLDEYKSREQLMDAFFSNHRDWDDDLAYLLSEYPPADEQELMKYLSGAEVVEAKP